MRARHACLLLLALACLSTASATSRRLLDEYLPDVIGGGEATLGRGSRGTAGDTVGVVAEHAPPAEVGEQVPPTGTTAETQPPSTEAGPPSADTQLPSGTGDEAIGDGESDSGFFDEIAKTVQESLSDLMGTFESDEDVQEVAQEAVDRVDEMLGDVEEAKGIKEEIEELVEMAKGLRDADPEKQAAARTSINKAVLDLLLGEGKDKLLDETLNDEQQTFEGIAEQAVDPDIRERAKASTSTIASCVMKCVNDAIDKGQEAKPCVENCTKDTFFSGLTGMFGVTGGGD